MHYIFYIFDPLEDRIADAKKIENINLFKKLYNYYLQSLVNA